MQTPGYRNFKKLQKFESGKSRVLYTYDSPTQLLKKHTTYEFLQKPFRKDLSIGTGGGTILLKIIQGGERYEYVSTTNEYRYSAPPLTPYVLATMFANRSAPLYTIPCYFHISVNLSYTHGKALAWVLLHTCLHHIFTFYQKITFLRIFSHIGVSVVDTRPHTPLQHLYINTWF